MLRLFTAYFTKVKEKHLRANLVLIYELLEEACDAGVPQLTDAVVLKELVLQKGTHVAGASRRSLPALWDVTPACQACFPSASRVACSAAAQQGGSRRLRPARMQRGAALAQSGRSRGRRQAQRYKLLAPSRTETRA